MRAVGGVDAVETKLETKIGRFEIRRTLGEGAFGKVYEAFDPQLDRSVALKVAKIEGGDADRRVKRFLREAKTAAMLRHPNIVPLYEYGQDSGRFHIASAFICGKTLQEELGARRTSTPDLQWSIRTIRRMAEALGYAHAQGIVHRDVKPANTMIDENGEPLVMDFGLASRQDEAEQLTHDGTVMGTPLYMSPEQAKGKEGAALPASDQYALGVMLYEMIVGEPPFRGAPELVMHHHMETQAPRPSKANRAISRDLETICLKCLEKDPARRYSDCNALADDLRRVEVGEPISARPIGMAEKLVRWSRKNPGAMIALTLFVLTLIGGSIVSGLLANWAFGEAARATDAETDAKGKAESERLQAEIAKKQTLLAEQNALTAEKNAREAKENELIAKRNEREAKAVGHGAKIALALAGRSRSDWPFMSRILAETDPEFGSSFENGLVRSIVARHSIPRWKLPVGSTSSVSFSPDGKRMAVGCADKTIRVVDSETGKEMRSISGHLGPVNGVAFAFDGKSIASCDERGAAFVWDADSGMRIVALEGHSKEIWCIAMNRFGTLIATASDDGTARLWNMQTGKQERVLKGHQGAVLAVAFDSKSKHIATCGEDKSVRIWNVETGVELAKLVGHHKAPTSLAFSPDDTRLASGSDDKSARIWTRFGDVWIGESTIRQELNAIHCVAFSPDGKHLAIGGDGPTASVWEVGTGSETLKLKTLVQKNAVTGIAFSPDGTKIATSTYQGAWLWNFQADSEHLRIQAAKRFVRWVAISSDETRIATLAEDKAIRVWDAESGQFLHALNEPASQAVFAPDGKKLLTVSSGFKQNPPGRLTFGGPTTGTISLWDLESNTKTWATKYSANALALAPDGKRFATGSTDKSVIVWNAETGEKEKTLTGHKGVVMAVAFDVTGTLLASAGSDGALVWDLSTGKAAVRLQGHQGGVSCIAFHPEGKLLATGGSDFTVRLWNTADGTALRTLKGHYDLLSAPTLGHFGVYAVRFSPDGKRVASAAGQPRLPGELKIWDIDTGVEKLALSGHSELVSCVEFSRTGKFLATACWDGIVRVWSAAAPRGAVPRTP